MTGWFIDPTRAFLGGTGRFFCPQITQMDADFFSYTPLQKPVCIAFVRLRVFAGVCHPRVHE